MAGGNFLEEIDRSRITTLARCWLGTPYHHQASLKGLGCDCIGLVRGVYKELYNYDPPVPNYSWDWGDVNNNEGILKAAFEYLNPIDLKDYDEGDVVVLRWKYYTVAKHAMILTSTNTAIHAYNKSPVSEIHLSDWWKARIVSAFKFPGVQ